MAASMREIGRMTKKDGRGIYYTFNGRKST